MKPHLGAVTIGVGFATLGVALLGDQSGWWTLDMRLVWPTALLVLGLAILAGRPPDQDP